MRAEAGEWKKKHLAIQEDIGRLQTEVNQLKDKSEQKSFMGCSVIIDPDMPDDEVRMINFQTKSTIRIVNLEAKPSSSMDLHARAEAAESRIAELEDKISDLEGAESKHNTIMNEYEEEE